MTPSLNLALLLGSEDGLRVLLPGAEPRQVDGPGGVHSLDTRNTTAIAGTSEGAWLHTNGSWRQVLEGDVRRVRIGPDNLLLVGVWPAALLASSDGGKTWDEWTSLQNLIRYHGQRIGAKAAPEISGIAFASGIVTAVAGIGAFLTLDRGRTWALHSEGLDRQVHGLWDHPERTDRLYATAPSGFYRSEDGGYSWVQSLHGLDRSWGGDVTVLPGVPDTLLLGAARGGDGAGSTLYCSPDGGITWTRQLLGGRDEWERPVLVDRLLSPVDALFALAGSEVWGSHDRGDHWLPIADGLPPIRAFASAIGEW